MGSRGRVVLIAQQISFAKILAGNDKRARDKGIKKLQKYLTFRSQGSLDFTEDDFMRIWKGLFYCVWMSDKPLIQEDLAEKISHLIHCFNNPKSTFNFIKTFFLTMGLEWYGIDQHRLDKFLMLVRRFLRQSLVYCQQRDWSEDLVLEITSIFRSTVLSTSTIYDNIKPPLGFMMHFTDVFLEELAKVSEGKVPEDIMPLFLRPFVHHLSEQDDSRSRSHIVNNIFHHLMKQTDQGMEYEEKFAAWKSAGFPGKSWKDMKRVEMESDSDHEGNSGEELATEAKDPRAGRVNVVLSQLHFDAKAVATLLLEYAGKSPILKIRKTLHHLAQQFCELVKGNYPLAFKINLPKGVMKKKRRIINKTELWKAAKQLNNYEESLYKLEESMNVAKSKKRKRKQEDNALEKSVVPLKKKQRKEMKENEGEVLLPEKKCYTKKQKKREIQGAEHNVNIEKNTFSDLYECSTRLGVGEQRWMGSSKHVLHGKGVHRLNDTKIELLLASKEAAQSNIQIEVPVKLKKKQRNKFIEQEQIDIQRRKDIAKKKKQQRHSLSQWNVSDISSTQNEMPIVNGSANHSELEKSTEVNIKNIVSVANVNKRKKADSVSPAEKRISPGKIQSSTSTPKTPTLGKKVNIALQMNKEQMYQHLKKKHPPCKTFV